MKAPARTKNIMLKASDEEMAMVHALADAQGAAISRVLRRLIVMAYVERFGLTKPPKPRLKHQPKRKRATRHKGIVGHEEEATHQAERRVTSSDSEKKA